MVSHEVGFGEGLGFLRDELMLAATGLATAYGAVEAGSWNWQRWACGIATVGLAGVMYARWPKYGANFNYQDGTDSGDWSDC